MSRGSGVGGDNHGRFDFNFRILQFAHLVTRPCAAYYEYRNEEINQVTVFESPFADVCHNNPPILVLLVADSGVTVSPS